MPVKLDEKQLNKWIGTFLQYLSHMQGYGFESFADSETTVRLLREERYKEEFYTKAKETIQSMEWSKDTIGTGAYTEMVCDLVSNSKHNLVYRFQKTAFCEAARADVEKTDILMYRLFAEQNDENSFAQLIDTFGRRYDLIAFLMSLKPNSGYLPISGQLENGFRTLNMVVQINNQCSWDNYLEYCDAVKKIHSKLVESDRNATLLHAHSFLWVLSRNEDEIVTGAKKEKATPNYKKKTSQNMEDDLDEELKRKVSRNSIQGKAFVVQPEKKSDAVYFKGHRSFPRSAQKAANALYAANYKCEYEKTHFTFQKKSNGAPYTEPHHLVPLSFSDQFEYSLDVEANIVSLCSTCHNWLHYGENAKPLLEALFDQRKELLEKAGIVITIDELVKMYQ